MNPLFQLMTDSLKMGAAFEGAHPTTFAKATQEQLAEVLEEVPRFEPTEADLRRMAAEFDETFSEGRIHRPAHRINPHD